MSRAGESPTILEAMFGALPPGLPVVLCGPSGSGRSVLCLEQVHRELARGRSVAFLTAEPARLLIQQASAMELDLEDAIRGEALRLLELEPDAAETVRLHGGRALASALGASAPGAGLVIIDPVTAATAEMLDERALRAAVRDLFEELASEQRAVVVTAELEAVRASASLERALKDACGAYAELDVDAEAGHRLRVTKSRTGVAGSGILRFRVGPSGPVLADEGRATAAPSPRPTEQPAAAPDPRPRILVVDHDDAARSQLVEWLSGDYEAVATADAFSAISAVLQRRPELVILDPRLPRVSGHEVMRSLREAGVRLPILIFSAHLARAADRVRALVLGATDLMDKPASRFELLRKVDTLLRLSPAADTAPVNDDVEILLGNGEAHRILDDAAFRDRLELACRFGEQFNLPSVLVAVKAASADGLDALVGSAEPRLRPEDALLLVSKTRALLLLVACPLAQADVVLRRIGGAPGTEVARLRQRAHESRPLAPGRGWSSLFEDLAPWPADRTG